MPCSVLKFAVVEEHPGLVTADKGKAEGESGSCKRAGAFQREANLARLKIPGAED